MRKGRKKILGVLLGFAMVLQLTMPVTAKTQSGVIRPEKKVMPQSRPVGDVGEVLAPAMRPKIEVTGVYTAWQEELPAGLKTSRTNILGTDRMIMPGSYVDFVVSADLYVPEDAWLIQIRLTAQPSLDEAETVMYVGSDQVADSRVELSFAKDVKGVMTHAPAIENGKSAWSWVSDSYVKIDGEEADFSIAYTPGTNTNPATWAWGNYDGTVTMVSDIHPDIVQMQSGNHHLEVTFRVYAFTEEESKDYEFYSYYIHGYEIDI